LRIKLIKVAKYRDLEREDYIKESVSLLKYVSDEILTSHEGPETQIISKNIYVSQINCVLIMISARFL
jgi:hypothetical protein